MNLLKNLRALRARIAFIKARTLATPGGGSVLRNPVIGGLVDLAAGAVLFSGALALLPGKVGWGSILMAIAAFAIVSRSIFMNLLSAFQDHRAGVPDADLQSAVRRLYQDRQVLSDQLDELSAIREVSLAVGSILDFDDMIKAILDLTTSYFDVDKAFIYVSSSEEKVLEVAGARAGGREIAPARVLQKRIPEGVGIVGRASQEHREIVETDERKGIVAAIPLVHKSRVVGVLKITDSRGTSRLPERRRQMHAISSAIAVAMENARLYRLAVTDGLTGLFVHRHFQNRLEDEFARSLRYDTPLALVFIDIDHFKKFNDTYGHTTGDIVLKGVARILQEAARGSDLVCRYGGEEMAIICPQTVLSGALQLAERIRSRIASTRFRDAEGQTELSVNISAGVAIYTPGMERRKDLIDRADQALYAAKERGRNRVVTLDEEIDAAVA